MAGGTSDELLSRIVGEAHRDARRRHRQPGGDRFAASVDAGAAPEARRRQIGDDDPHLRLVQAQRVSELTLGEVGRIDRAHDLDATRGDHGA